VVLQEHGGGSLRFMHERSLHSGVSSHELACSTYVGSRTKAVSWLTSVFEEHRLRDEWMVATIALLDRVAVAECRRSANAGASKPAREDCSCAEWLAAVLCVLKLSSAEADPYTWLLPTNRVQSYKHVSKFASMMCLMIKFNVTWSGGPQKKKIGTPLR
jgi:hypothetical protein